MKKVLSIVMALAMVLTMATFPAFAEGAAVAIVGVTGKTTNYGKANTIDKLYDGNSTSTHFTSDQDNGKFTIVLQLEKKITLDSLTINWGSDGDWGQQGPKSYTVAVSEDGSAFERILSYEGLHDKTTAAATYPGYTYISGSTGGADMKFDVVETGLNKRNVQYIQINVTASANRAAIREVVVTEKEEAALVATSYTVKHQYADGSQAADDQVFDTEVYVGDEVVAEALDIEGYMPDAASKTLTLADGTNEIVFTYTARTAATYTVNYVDVNGDPITDAKVVETGYYEGDVVTETAVKVPGYKPTEDSKEVTLAAGENTITFTYDAKSATSYTINYVDVSGNPIADAVAGDSYEDEVVTATAPVIKGYFYVGKADDAIVDYTKTITLDADAENNVINFVYKKVLPLASKSAKALGGVSGFWSFEKIYDNVVVSKVTDGDGAQPGDPKANDENVAEIVYQFDGLYEVNKVTAYWKSSSSYASAVEIYTSINGEDWAPVYSTEDVVYTTKQFANTSVKADPMKVMISEFDLEPSTGMYVKFVINEITAGWGRFLELEVEGTPLTAVELTGANISVGSNWGWAESSAITNGTASALVDGKEASDAEALFNHGYSSSVIAGTANDIITVDLGGVIDNPIVTVQGGGGTVWAYGHLVAYEIYVAGVDGVYGEYPVGGVDYNGVDFGAIRKRTDLHFIEGEAIRYIKIVPTAKVERATLGEITVFGTLTDVEDKPEDTIATIGGSIRLPKGSISAGIRFGATVLKETVGIEGEYVYDPAATTTFGMFLIPKDLLGGATFADYLAANDYKGSALKVPAQRIYSQDNFAVTYTAVLVDIPAAQYARDIVAVPYICTNGTYAFSSEIVRNYAEVAGSVAAAYENGEISLTADQITLIESIIGRPLVAPEVAE